MYVKINFARCLFIFFSYYCNAKISNLREKNKQDEGKAEAVMPATLSIALALATSSFFFLGYGTERKTLRIY